MILEQKAKAQGEEIRKELTPEMRDKMDRGQSEIRSYCVEEKCLKAGQCLPDVKLLNREGEEVRLLDLVKTGPMIVGFYRGRWCPVCMSQLKAFQDHMPQITQAGLRLVFISPQTPEETGCTQDEGNFTFTLLSDPGNRAAEAFRIAYASPEETITVYQYLGISLPKYNGDDSWRLPIPALYLVDKDGGIDYAYCSCDYTNRADPEKIIHQIHEMQKKIGVML